MPRRGKTKGANRVSTRHGHPVGVKSLGVQGPSWRRARSQGDLSASAVASLLVIWHPSTPKVVNTETSGNVVIRPHKLRLLDKKRHGQHEEATPSKEKKTEKKDR